MTLSGTSAQQNSSGPDYFRFQVRPSDLVTTGDPTTDSLESPPKYELRDPRELHKTISSFIEEHSPHNPQGSSVTS